jgi:UDP-N-acetylmuramoyl-L-alanyl-D-glutamate--2,6-diaminopimelate ligase
VDACEFDIGVVTNITHEHLDEHGSYENYRAAKARLFQSLEYTLPKPRGNVRLSVLNRDDSSYDYLTKIAPGPKVSYGLDTSADVHAINMDYKNGLKFDAIGAGFHVPVSSNLVGEYNVSNCLAALTAAIQGMGIDPVIAARGIASMDVIPGRWEQIHLGQDFAAIVDFAHTPNALRVVVENARKITDKRVIVIFGSAGLRDREKRRMMAEVATEMADISILTAEDPRTESLEEILGEMASGALSKGGMEEKTFWRVPDRGDAIRLGVRMASTGDIVIACGKGHEQSMCFGTIEYPWDDRTALQAALSELLGLEGPRMPNLPTKVK